MKTAAWQRVAMTAMLVALAVSIVGTTGLAARAATIGSVQNDGVTIITVEGEFTSGDEVAFKRKLLETDAKVIALASPGGALTVGIEIGRVARWQGLATMVPDGSTCASACALAWLGGQPRFMGTGARIGFHAAYRLDDAGAARETGAGNALVGSYVTQLGLSDEAIVYITQSAPEEMQWLTLSDAGTLGIAVRPLGGNLEATPAPQPAPVPSTKQVGTCRVADVRPPDDWLALRTEPSSRRGRQLSRMRRGQTFDLLGDQQGDWYLVQLPDGQTGWVSWSTRRWIQC